MSKAANPQFARKLLRYGILLFLIGLITGFIIPEMQNPRMGLSSHLQGLLNGMFLLLLGIIWPKLHLTSRSGKWAYFSALYGAYINWLTTFFAGIWGAGQTLMPIASGEYLGEGWQEGLIQFGLISLSLAMLIVSGLVLWGLRGEDRSPV